MKILKIGQKNLKNVLKTTSDLILKGNVVICPTDTVYGLICDATNKKAVEKLFKIKKRPKGKPISIFVKDIKMAKKYAKINQNQEKFLEKIWPGAVTAVLKPQKNLPKNISQGKNTIGVRIPDYKLILKLIDKINLPLGESSANISGKPASTELRKILSQFKYSHGRIRIPRGRRPRVALFACPDLVLDEGNLKKAKPSTVIDLTEPKPKIIRKGQVKQSEIMRIFEKT